MSHSIFDFNRAWFNHAFDNSDVRPVHHAIYFFALELNNRLGWKEQFDFPSSQAMEATGIKSYNTYIKAFREIVNWNFFILHRKSQNQFQANRIALSKIDKSSNTPLDKSVMNHVTNQCCITEQITDSKIRPYTNKPKKQETNRRFTPPSVDDILNFMSFKGLPENIAEKESKAFFDHYESNGWKVGNNKMKNWKSAISGWINRMPKFNNSPQNPNNNGSTSNHKEPRAGNTSQSGLFKTGGPGSFNFKRNTVSQES